MNAEKNLTPIPPAGLRALSEVKLNTHHQKLLDFATLTCGGAPVWRHRKSAEGRDLLALAQISNRLRVEWLDLFADLRALVHMEVPVPCLPKPNGPLEIAPLATLGITYRQEAMLTATPGPSFVQILAPRSVWHANVSVKYGQLLCLGSQLPAGIPLREIVLMTYGALSMMTTQLDLLDPAGVLNPGAADWWQRNTKLIPLSREPFLKTPEVKP